jgi:hypothetical protein
MPRLLLRTHAAVQDCEEHLRTSGASGTEIESYLTQYLLIVLSADIQQEIYRLSEERTAAATDDGLSSFVGASARKILRSIGKPEIAKYLGMFGADCKNKLNSQLTDSEVAVYTNAVSGRHEVAHNQGVLISFAEFKSALSAAEKILAAAAYSLGLGPALTVAVDSTQPA